MVDSESPSHFTRRVIDGLTNKHHRYQDGGKQKGGILPYDWMCMWRVGPELARGKHVEAEACRNLYNDVNKKAQLA